VDGGSLTLLLVHLAATGLMTGLIWFVQVVHYPLFAAVPADEFAAYERAHVSRTGALVGPIMLAEAASVAGILLLAPAGVPRWMAWAGLAMLAVLWISTFAVQVPLHRRLESGHDADVIRRLVLTNWLRTVFWSMRGALATWMLIAFVGAAASPSGPA
jgi:hypothetical protein